MAPTTSSTVSPATRGAGSTQPSIPNTYDSSVTGGISLWQMRAANA